LSKQVIVIDDSCTARQQVITTLSGVGYEVVEAVNGVDGLQKIAEHPGASLVLCDLNMPAMSGLDVLRRLRDAPRAEPLIVVMFTTDAEPDLVRSAKQAGAKGWIVKPFKPDLLIAAVRKLLGDS
jgi:two-component system chemotaxis response regulator CheY